MLDLFNRSKLVSLSALSLLLSAAQRRHKMAMMLLRRSLSTARSVAPLSASKYPAVETLAATYSANVPCPGCESPKAPPSEVAFECPQCGFPVACSSDCAESTLAGHAVICPALAEAREDLEYLSSPDARAGLQSMFQDVRPPVGSVMTRTDHSEDPMPCWETFIKERGFAPQNEQQLRHLTSVFTYPMSLALFATAFMDLRPQAATASTDANASTSPMASTSSIDPTETAIAEAMAEAKAVSAPPPELCVLGARAEAGMPPWAWGEAGPWLRNRGVSSVHVVGPMVVPRADMPLSDQLVVRYNQGYFEDRYGTGPDGVGGQGGGGSGSGNGNGSNPRKDYGGFVLFNPGLGQASRYPLWDTTIRGTMGGQLQEVVETTLSALRCSLGNHFLTHSLLNQPLSLTHSLTHSQVSSLRAAGSF